LIIPISYDKIFSIQNTLQFNEALSVILSYQLLQNSVYADFYRAISSRQKKEQLIYLPVSFFKTHEVNTGGVPEEIFLSSSTTGAFPSKHFVTDSGLYRRSLLESFSYAWGNPEDYTFVSLLPSYLERGNSSLVFMMNELMKISKHAFNGFYLHNYSELAENLRKINDSGEKCIFLGVSYALQEFAEKFPMKLNTHISVMETGGTKGLSKNILKEELHQILCQAFGKEKIHSEYGMTELLSQCYSKGDGIYQCPPWVKVTTRDIYDPLTLLTPGQPGALNIIDLANMHSCPFVATDDTGMVFEDGTFKITGRLQLGEIRGCNLLL
jgi:hypothetical protein